MSSKNPIDKAKALPAGAVFHCCALQVNPHQYGATFRGKPAEKDEAAYAKAIVDKSTELGITVLAITDHNHVSSVAAFRAVAHGRGVDILPGFELSSSEGVHVLCIYPQDTDDHRFGRYLGEFGITNPGPSSDLSSKTFIEVLKKVREQGGVATAAHVTNDNGLFKVLSGKPRIQAGQSDNLFAIQIPGPVEDLPLDVRQIR